jgi:type VI secretion system protein
MGRERMLLDRIAAGGARGGGRYEPSTREDLVALMDSVRRQLARLLNARHGFSEAMPDYGLPALTDLTMGSGDHVRRIRDAIRVAIEKYEPRLRRVRVVQMADEDERQMLSFRIDAALLAQSGEHRVSYETAMTGSGQFDVSE